MLTILGLEGPNTQDKVERVTAASGFLFEDMRAQIIRLVLLGHLEHRARKVSKSKQFLSEPVVPMPFMQQGIWILHTVSSSCVFQLRSAWTLLSLFLQHWVRSSELAVDRAD